LRRADRKSAPRKKNSAEVVSTRRRSINHKGIARAIALTNWKASRNARDGRAMSERPWMPLYVNDFQIDTTGLTADQRGVYITMLCLAWRSGDGSVSGDMEELKTVLQNIIANFHGLTFNRVVPKLLDRYFQKRASGRFYHPGVEKQLRIARELSEKQSRNAKERWSRDRRSNGLVDATANRARGGFPDRRSRMIGQNLLALKVWAPNESG
jgi:uncharacterized protein YdaU (DUF1376 family)